MSSSAAMAAMAACKQKQDWESKAALASTGQRTFFAESLYDLITLLTVGKDECSVQMSHVPVHEAAAVVEVLSRAERSQAVEWKNPKLKNLRRLRDLSSKLQVVLDGLLVLLEEDSLNIGAARELWKYGWALRNGADHLQGQGAVSFRSVGNLLIRHGDNVQDASKTAEWLRARLPDLREKVTGLQAMSVAVPLDKYGPVDIGSGSGSKAKVKAICGGSSSKGKTISIGSGSKVKAISGGSSSKGKTISIGSGSKVKAVSGGSGSKVKISGGSGSKLMATSGGSGSKLMAISGGSGNNGVDGSGGASVKKGYTVNKKARYVKKRFGKGGSGSGSGGSGESGVSGNGGSGGAPVKKKKKGVSGEGVSGKA